MRLSASILMNFFPGLNVFETKFSRQRKKKKKIELLCLNDHWKLSRILKLKA